MSSDTIEPILVSLGKQITLYCPIIIIVFGTIGCLCNLITLASQPLRKSSCSLYFIGEALFDLVTLDFGMLTRFLSDNYGYDPSNRSKIYCNLRIYIISVSPAMATCCVVLAAMDRFMSTSSEVRYRSFATIKCAKWIAAMSLIICILSYLHYMVFSDLQPMCALQKGAYSVFAVVFNIVWTSICPHFLMVSFGLGTCYHIRKRRNQVIPPNVQQRRLQRTQRQLVMMMLAQVGISSLLILTRVVYFSYSIITTGLEKTAYTDTLEKFFSQLTTQFFYLNYAKSFYIYALCSKYFRTTLVSRISTFFHRLIHR